MRLISVLLSLLSSSVYATDGFNVHTTIGGEGGGPMVSNSIGSSNMNSVFHPAAPIDYSGIRNQAEASKREALALEQKRAVVEASIQLSKSIHSFSVEESVDDMLNRLTQDLLEKAPNPHIDVNSISDPLELPYKFTANEGVIKEELKRIYTDLYKINPYYENRKQAREFGLISVEEADLSSSRGAGEDANFYKELAKGFLDIAVGLDPVSGFARSTYELFSGKNLVTGLQLSLVERSLAFVGAVTAGGGRSMVQATRGMAKVFQRASHMIADKHAAEIAIREGERLIGHAGHLLNDWKKSHRITSIREATQVNAAFTQGPGTYLPPYEHGSYVVFFDTVKKTKWVRVHCEENKVKAWVMKKSSIQGLTPERIRIKYALPKTPTLISDVHVPSGTPMSRGSVQFHNDFTEMPLEAPSGAIQYRLEKSIDASNFKNTRQLPEVFYE